MVGFASNERQKQVLKFISVHQLSGGSLRQTLLRMWERTSVKCKGCVYISLESIFFPPFLRAAFIFSWLVAPNLVSFPPVVFNQGDFCSPGDFVVGGTHT